MVSKRGFNNVEMLSYGRLWALQWQVGNYRTVAVEYLANPAIGY